MLYRTSRVTPQCTPSHTKSHSVTPSHVSVTVSGRTCQSWSSSTPHTHVFNHGNMFTPCSLQLRQLVHSLQTTRLLPRQQVDTQQSSTAATCSLTADDTSSTTATCLHPAVDTSSTRTISSPTAASRTPPTTAATRTDTAPAHPTALFSSLLFSSVFSRPRSTPWTHFLHSF